MSQQQLARIEDQVRTYDTGETDQFYYAAALVCRSTARPEQDNLPDDLIREAVDTVQCAECWGEGKNRYHVTGQVTRLEDPCLICKGDGLNDNSKVMLEAIPPTREEQAR